MATLPFQHAGQARAALHAIVSDPAHGADALDSSQTTANLLRDFLPDAPRETDLLIAAARAGLPAMLRGYAAQGVDARTAVSLAASAFADRTAFTPAACEWAATELAIALGLAGAMGLPAVRLSSPTETAAVRAGPSAGQTASIISPLTPATAPAVHIPARRRSRKPVMLAGALAVLALVVAGSFELGSARGKPPAAKAASSHVSKTHAGSARATPSGQATPSASQPLTPVVPVVSIGQFSGTRPARLQFSADGGSFVTGITWSSWTSSGASGAGIWNHTICVPNCATGPVQQYPATLQFSDVQNGMFTVLTTIWDGQTSTWYYPGGWPLGAS